MAFQAISLCETGETMKPEAQRISS